MARPKRKNHLPAKEAATASQAVKQYRVAGYIRLSIEDSEFCRDTQSKICVTESKKSAFVVRAFHDLKNVAFGL